MKYDVLLEDGTLVAKSDGVEFTVQEGIFFSQKIYMYKLSSILMIGCNSLWLFFILLFF